MSLLIIINLILIVMDKMEPVQFFLSSLLFKGNRYPYCFDKCIKRQEIGNELSRNQERCLGNCTQKYAQAVKRLAI